MFASLLLTLLPHGKLRLVVFATLFWASFAAEETHAETPAEIFQAKCASCHGDDGGGVAGLYETPLYGDESIAELAKRVDETMPEDDPEACVGEQARQVAEYIYGAFYSIEARRKHGLLPPEHIELSHLTVLQHRNAVADLLASFSGPPQASGDAEGGLKAQYYESKLMNKADSLKLERIDRRLDFDFGEAAPIEGIDPTQFSITWRGSIFARDTGLYEFRTHTPNGVRLSLNAAPAAEQGKLRDDSSASLAERLIDGWVTIGKKRTLTGKMFLLGGHYYPLQLTFFKYQDPSASLRVEWKPPHGVWQVMDEQVLSTRAANRTFAAAAPFPPDDRSLGYERGSTVSRQWYAAATATAVAAAEEVVDRLPTLSGVSDDAQNRSAKLGKFLIELASRAFRRPLTPEETKLYGSTLFEDGPPNAAVRRGVILILTSPHFLYVELPNEDRRPTAYQIAARLAFALWDTLPDAELRRAAKQNELATPEQIASQAERMLTDSRTKTKLQGFFRHWLELEERDLTKDRTAFPEFDEAVIADLRRSLELFTDQVLWSEASDYRELLEANYLLLNARLRKLYFRDKAEQAETQKLAKGSSSEYVAVPFDSEGRAGILTHPYLLSAFAYYDNTSPIHRGVFLTRNVIGRRLKPPPQATSFNNAEFPAELTMREKVTRLTRDQACMSCHEVINPLGFALENYDAIGRWRTTENDRPIDTASEFTSLDGDSHAIASARDIATFAVNSRAAQRAFVKQVFLYLVRQNPAAYGPEVIEQLTDDFVIDFNMQRLLVRIAALTAAHDLEPPN